MARPISKTTKFILALPRDLPAKEVLAKAKASGFKTSESNVHRVRRLHGSASKAPAAAAAAVARNAAPSGKGQKKSEFVRSFSVQTPAKDIVAKAKASGVHLDLQYVYKIRSRAKPANHGVALVAPGISAPRVARNGAGTVEALLRALGAEIGLGRAVEILQDERARVSSLTRHLA
jgi:hypothetical protein